MRTGVWWGSPKERDHFEGQGVNGKIILGWIFKGLNGGTDWIDMA